jgi:DNA polymerase I-like protein with 3'-5' exonuclease and polymerase domains
MFIPPKDYIFFDADYSAIDLHFVVWESGCEFLKKLLKAGKDPYSVLASHYYQREITKKDNERQIFKSIAHGSHYLGRPTTLAAKAGLSVPQVKKVLDWYFGECPEIPDWHQRIDRDCKTKRFTTNIFGARFWCMDLSDPMYLNKMVAAVPQSSAGTLVNKALVRMEESEQQRNSSKILPLLQVHDSIAGIYHKDDTTALERIKGYLELTIPYKDPLVIPAAIKTSSLSYGDCR